MNKWILILIMPLCLSSIVWAQEEEKTPSRHQIGINATYFTSNFLGLNQNDLILGPYAISYKLRMKKTYLRLGFGGKASNSTRENDFAANIFDRKTQIFDVRAGLEWQKPLTDRWLLFYGIDAIVGGAFNQTIALSSFDEVVNNINKTYFGAGPEIGIQFFINDRISLSTESTFYTKAVYEVEKTSFRNFPNQNTNESVVLAEFETAIPVELFFIIHF